MELFPNAPRDPLYYELGYGQLTEVGKNRALQLGTLLNTRYHGLLLNDARSNGEVYAYSTDYDRTKMSLQLVLKGLYPTSSKSSVVPLHYEPRIVDSVLQGFRCSKYKDEERKVKKSKAYQTLMTQNSELFKFINRETGLNTSTENNPLFVTAGVYNVFASEKSMNISLPTWATEEIQQKIETIVAIEYELESYTPTMKRLFGGNVVKEFIDNMDRKNVKIAGNNTKIFLYSGHELNVASFAKVHGFTEPAIPLYSSAIFVEKWRDADQEYVQMYLWTGVTEELIPYKIPYCGTKCPYDTYKSLVQEYIPTKLELDCLWNDVTKKILQNYYLNTNEEK
ncbi:venom acid phosphatase Acph-1-like [Ceratina calcarata]|uniref:acid phosphatase n=1 Tax=Ceratina calcarata TaxID=156304 RepID=A0AAJ7J2H4_9HYME|nr:venom acid phosphatase Acph-1-like [Ceratina calcarata]